MRPKNTISIDSDYLHSLMNKKNISKQDLSSALGISQTYLWMLLEGKRNPSTKLREKILNYFEDSETVDMFIDSACNSQLDILPDETKNNINS